MAKPLKNHAFGMPFCDFVHANGKIKLEVEKSYPQPFLLQKHKKVA